MEEDDNEETYLSANHIFFNNTNNIKNNTIYIYVYTTVYCGPLPAGKVSVITRNTGDAKLNTLTAPNTLNTTNPAFHAFENVSDSIASFSGPGGGGGRSKSISSSSSSTRARHGKVLCFLLLLEVGLDFGDAMLIFPTIERREKDDRDLDAAFFFAADDDDADAPTTTRELECPIANIFRWWWSSSSSARKE